MTRYRWAACAAVLIAAGLAAGCGGGAEDHALIAAAHFKARAEQAVERLLRDPGSAQYPAEQFYIVDGHVNVCGVVNARNGFGGMAGPRRFYVTDGDVEIEGYTRLDFRKAWAVQCAPGAAASDAQVGAAYSGGL